MSAVCHFADLEVLSGRQRRLSVFAYPRFRRAGDGWAETSERFQTGDPTWIATALEGVHQLQVRRDGLMLLTHMGRSMSFRLVGFAAIANGELAATRALNLANWDLDTALLDAGLVAFTHPATGARYEILFRADGVHDRLALTAAAKALMRQKLPAGTTRVGLIFDATMPDQADFDTEEDVQFASPTQGRLVLRPAALCATAAAPLDLPVARERWLWRLGKLAQTVPVDALDLVSELRTSVTYQEGASGYSGCIDTLISSGNATTNYGTQNYIHVGLIAAGDWRRTLVQFDLSSLVGIGITAVNSATLSLYFFNADSGFNASTAQVLVAWGEATATYNTRDGANNWITAGCGSEGNDRTAYGGSTTITATGFTAWPVTSIVSDWLVTENPNYGIIVKSDDESSLVTSFRSSEYAGFGTRPKITVDYTVGAAGNPWYARAQQ